MMKPSTNFILFSLLITCFITLNAQHYASSTLAYNHLYEVNKEWAKHKNASTLEEIQFPSDADQIQFHLYSVIDYLSKNIPTQIKGESKTKRLALLKDLQGYANTKQFPKNIHHAVRRPYFIDHEGTYCAVGYLMATSGAADLAHRISEKYNYDYVKDIKTDGVTEWANENGFTIDELAWIQPGYSPSSILLALENGTNGAVNAMHIYQDDNFEQKLIFAGDFTILNDLPCLNIGYYQEEQLHCLGAGLGGEINDVFSIAEGIAVVGELTNGNSVFPMAVFYNEQWHFINIPGREGASGTTGLYIGSLYGFEISISHPSIPNQQEIWHLNNQDEWTKKATINGVVLDIDRGFDGRVYAGHFNQVTVPQTDGNDTSIAVFNAVLRADTWQPMGVAVSDTVKVLKSIGGVVYMGGTCPIEPDEDESDVCLSRYLNGVLQPMILSNHFQTYETDTNTAYTINAIELQEGNLVLGGIFNLYPLLGIIGNNFARYDLTFNFITPLAFLDKGINAMAQLDDDIYIGGDFTKNLNTQNMKHLARTQYSVGVEFINEDDDDIRLFPNPAKDRLNIEGINSSFEYVIYDLTGKEVYKGRSSQSSIKLNHLIKGIYILNLRVDDKTYHLKFLKK